jgi:anthranilate synthase component 1
MFNGILSELTVSQARDKQVKSAPKRYLIFRDIMAMQEFELQLLARLVNGFPASNINVVLLVNSSASHTSKLQTFGKNLLSWEVEGEPGQVKAEPIDVYRMLRLHNPSPYMYLFQFSDGISVVGSSPEALVKVNQKEVMVHPIAGPRKRSASPEIDKKLAEELLADPKERAEHLMLVDLGRNDLGRICTPGSVEVIDFMHIERYSHVMHIVSTVTGTLSDKSNCVDALFAVFPAGTLSGAPKPRAMQIIEEHESTRRGIYGGAIGYIDFTGNIDTCIAIRTAVLYDGKAYVQAGAGIVADSDAESENQECRNKAAAVLGAIHAANTLASR